MSRFFLNGHKQVSEELRFIDSLISNFYLKNIEYFIFVIKAEFTHPVSACIYSPALQFFCDLPWFCSIKVRNKKLQCNAENACGNRMCKYALSNVQCRQFFCPRNVKTTNNEDCLYLVKNEYYWSHLYFLRSKKADLKKYS